MAYVAAYTELGGDEELPLGEEFQELLRRFVRPHEKKVPKRLELLRKLIDQLALVIIIIIIYSHIHGNTHV